MLRHRGVPRFGPDSRNGPRLAAKIAEKFGEDTFDILMHEPERLSELRGITDRKAKEIGRQFTEQSEMRLLMDF